MCGSGNTYTTASGGTARSLTPVGWSQIERRIEGMRNAPLGVLYDPLYFYRGWALHGSNSVPAHLHRRPGDHMVFLMILVGVLLAVVLQELVFDRLRLRQGRSLPRGGASAPLEECVHG